MATKKVPAQALSFDAPMEFAAANAGGGDGKSTPVKLLARSGKPITHWYWGKVAHDMAGMKMGAKIPIDYVHDSSEMLGFVDNADIKSGDLVLSGQLTPFKPDDRASEILFKGRMGVPYQASINFNGPITVEELDAGMKAQVNGYEFEGPGTIIRQWSLRGVAVCPYGADPNTKTSFNSAAEAVEVEVLSPSQEAHMSTPNPVQAAAIAASAKPATAAVAATAVLAADPAAGAAVTPPAQAAAPAIDPKAVPFIECFGDAGALSFVQGKSFESAAREFIAGQKLAHDQALAAQRTEFSAKEKALSDQVTDLTTKLAAAKVSGGNAAVKDLKADEPADPNAADPKASELTNKIGKNAARFAAGIKLPKPNRA